MLVCNNFLPQYAHKAHLKVRISLDLMVDEIGAVYGGRVASDKFSPDFYLLEKQLTIY